MMPSSLSAVLAVAMAMPAGIPQERPQLPRLERVWEVWLGSAGSRLKTAVCPDGTVHVTDSEGRLVGVDSAGKTIFDTRPSELGSVLSMACDGERLLVAAADSLSVHVFKRRPRQAPVFAGSHPVPLPAHQIATAHDGGCWILTSAHETRVQKLSATGLVEHSALLGPAATNDTSLILDHAKDRLLVVVPSTYEIHALDKGGELLERKASPDTGFSGSHFRAGDRILKAVALPGGRVAAAVSSVSWIRSNTYVNSVHLDLLGPGLSIEHGAISLRHGGPFGFLQGADASGNLYFAGLKNGAIYVCKARLVE